MSDVAGNEQLPVIDNRLATQQDNVDQLSEISRSSQTTFFALILACVYSYLALATTTDAALMSNSSATPLPIIQVNVPIVWFYYFAPTILAVLFVYFHLYLARFWRCVARLPLWHPDGRGLDDYVYPWLISSAFIRGGIPQLSVHRVSARLEAWLSLLLAWWLVPIVLLFYWARYLVAHDWPGTLLHVALVLVTVAFALRFLYTARNALQEMAKNPGSGRPSGSVELTRAQLLKVAVGLSVLAAALLYFSAAAIRGLSDEVCRNVGPEPGCGFYSPGRKIWGVLGIAPYSEVREERFVAKPENWQELMTKPGAMSNYLEARRALVLHRRDLRSLSARDAFLPGSRIHGGTLDYADLRHAVLTGSRLEEVTIRGADLTDADLQHARIVNVWFDQVVALAARFNHANFAGVTAEKRTRLSGDFSGAFFDAASGAYLLFHGGSGGQVETSLRETSLRETRFEWTTFKNVDLSGARIDEATMTNGTFVDTDFSRATIRGAILDQSTFTKCTFISSEIRDSSFERAEFVDSEFGHTPPIRSGEDSDASLPRPPRNTVTGFRGYGAKFIGKTRVQNTLFARADLRSATFEDVELENTSFSDSDLSHATFRDVDLSAVEFQRVDLSDADLAEARGISPTLLRGACGNAGTRLPPGMKIRACQKR